MSTIIGADIKRTYWSAETSFGTTLNSALKALGEVIDITPNLNFNPEEDAFENRAFTEVDMGPYEVGFSLTAKVWDVDAGVFDYDDFWPLYAFGDAAGPASDGRIDSFSMLTKKSTTMYALWNGCMVDGLTISAPGVGKSIIYQMDCRCQWVERSASKTFDELQSVTVGADPDLPTTDFDKWDGSPPTIDYGGGAGDLTGVIDWKMSVKNNLIPEFYERTGNDTISYCVAEYFDEGSLDIQVEINRWHRDETPLSYILARTEDMSLTLPINGDTWTLSGGYFIATWPDHKSGKDPLKEKLTIKFNDVSIA